MLFSIDKGTINFIIIWINMMNDKIIIRKNNIKINLGIMKYLNQINSLIFLLQIKLILELMKGKIILLLMIFLFKQKYH